jgi:acyl carrier protein
MTSLRRSPTRPALIHGEEIVNRGSSLRSSARCRTTATSVELDNDEQQEPPTMKTEYPNVSDRVAALVEIWCEVLEEADLDETSDFFENGGASLHALKIVSRVYDVLGVDIRPREVFTHPSPQSLLAHIENSQA